MQGKTCDTQRDIIKCVGYNNFAYDYTLGITELE